MEKLNFKMVISSGNDAMQTTEDVVLALHRIAKQVGRGIESGNVLDANGNTVGNWSLELPVLD